MNDQSLPAPQTQEEPPADSPAGLPADAIPAAPLMSTLKTSQPAGEGTTQTQPEPPVKPVGETPPVAAAGLKADQETQTRPTPAATAPPVPFESLIGKFLNNLLGANTPTGRFMRPFLRVAALTMGMFALGLLACYLIIYQPVEKQLGLTAQELLQTNNTLQTVREELAAVNESQQNTLARLDTVTTRVHLLRVLNQVSSARLALSNRASAVADQFLSEGKVDLEPLLPVIEKMDAQKAARLLGNYNQAIIELKRDPEQARYLLEDLWTVLRVLDKTLAGE
jgi:hypothetical protein